VNAPPGEDVSLRVYGALFATLLGVFVTQAALPEHGVARLVQVSLQGGALVAALHVGGVHGRLRRWAFVAVGLSVVAAVVTAVGGLDHGPLTGGVLLASGALVALAPPAVFRGVRRHTEVTVRTVLGALSVYLLIGLFFAFVARALAQFDPAAYRAADLPITPAGFQYFSFATLTTVGYGDVVAVSELARTAAVTEALIGQLYLVTIVALVVSNLGRGRSVRAQ
jgi:hypothetical protein